MAILAIELRRSAFTLCAPILLAVGGVLAHFGSFPRVASWANIADSMVNVSHFLAPFAAGLAAWEALRPTRRGMQSFEGTASIPAPRLRLPQLAAALIWLSACYLGILVYLIVRGLMLGLYDAPEVAVFIYGLLLPALFVVLGMCTSQFVKSWVAVPLSVTVSLLLYGLTFFGGVPDLISWVNVFTPYASADGTAPNAALFWALVVVSLSLAAVAAGSAVATYRPYRARSTLAAIVAGGALLAGAGIAVGQEGQSTIQLNEEQIELATFTSADGTLSVSTLHHYAPVSSELLATWERISRLFSESTLKFSELKQIVSNDHLDAPTGFRNLYLNPASPDIVENSVRMSLYDVMTCHRGQGNPSEGFLMQGTVIVETWLMGGRDLPNNAWAEDSRVQRGLEWLNGLDDDQAKVWVAEHAADIVSCSWTAEDFTPTQ